jgi:hypothetical protein
MGYGKVADVLGAVRTYFLSRSPITDVIGQRMYFQRRPQKSALPSATIMRVSESHDHLLSDRSGFVKTRLQVECFSLLQTTTESLAETIYKSGIAAIKGVTNSVDIRGVVVEDGRRDYTLDDPNGGDDHIYVSQFDLEVSYKE